MDAPKQPDLPFPHKESPPKVLRVIPMKSVELQERGLCNVDVVRDPSPDKQVRFWVRKQSINIVSGNEGIFAEALGWMLSRRLCIPTPEAAWGLDDDNRYWLSEFVNTSLPWSPENVYDLSNPDDLGAMLVLDIFLRNDDRHSDNVLLVPDWETGLLRLLSIDIEGASVGNIYSFQSKIEEETSIDLATSIYNDIPADLLEASAQRSIQKIRQYKDWTSLVTQASDVSDCLTADADRQKMASLLEERGYQLQTLTRQALDTLRGNA